ncbi:MAG: cytochrome-c peroxidase [Anaerolineae bacterium]|jgi:cytochrome c peroxidase
MPKNGKRWLAMIVLITLLLTLLFVGQGIAKDKLNKTEQLGEFLYFDENLSEPAGQACASCHLPSAGFVDPDSDLPVSEGVIPGKFGARNSPASAYAMYAPIRYFDGAEGLWIGGQFWDSRATGDVLGDPLADQALGPFLNPVEMANPDKATVVRDAMNGPYGGLFMQVCGRGNVHSPRYVEAAYNCIAESIGAFERTGMFGQFNSKYDAYLQDCLAGGGLPDDCAMGIGKEAKTAGKIFTQQEWKGLQLFMGDVNNNDGTLQPGEGAACVLCHVANFTPDPGNVAVPHWSPKGLIPPVFTDFTYDNLGVPVNPEIAELAGPQPTDLGLGAVVNDPDENGKFKVMTLRNIGLTAPYAHNGFFASLDEITHFYNTRDIPGLWPESEYADTVNFDELGNLGLSSQDEAALVQFMMTLSDGYTP